MTAPSVCRHCGRQIVWATFVGATGAKRTLPVEPEPSEDGDLVLYTEIDGLGDTIIADDGEAQHVRLGTEDDWASFGGRLWRSHYRSCFEAYERRARPAPQDPGR